MSALSAASALDLISPHSIAYVIWFRSELIVILMSANPSPQEVITLHKATHRAIMVAYSG